MGFQCAVCGQVHEEIPHDLAYTWPLEYLQVPPAERPTRTQANPDLCVIDGTVFLVRGVLPLPIRDVAPEDDPEFRWGVWVRVEESTFRRYLELWDVESISDPPFPGRLSGGIRGYADSDELEVRVELRPHGKRPHFWVVPEDNTLGQDQRAGISLMKAHSFIEDFMPDHFKARPAPSVLDYFRKKGGQPKE
jgi:hypothetical protein